MEKCISSKLASSASARARQRRFTASQRAQAQMRNAAFVDVWNDGIADRNRERLSRDMTFAKRFKGKFWGSATTEANLRQVFKETTDAGDVGRLGFFDAPSRANDATIVAAETILRKQREALLERHHKGGMCVLHWQFDGTPQRVAFQDPTIGATLTGKGDKDVKEQKVDEDDIDAPESQTEDKSPELSMIDTTLKRKVSLSPAALED